MNIAPISQNNNNYLAWKKKTNGKYQLPNALRMHKLKTTSYHCSSLKNRVS